MGAGMAFLMILNGVIVDAVDVLTGLTFASWQDWYSISRDVQLVGFALLAFLVCSYRFTEIKMATFFLVVWKAFVFWLNLCHGDALWSLESIVCLLALYLIWFVRAGTMDSLEQEEPKDGAYVLMMPIHSVFGLLKAIFMPWEMARYESIVLVQGQMLWAVNKNRFVNRRIEDTDLLNRPGIRRYLGRNLTHEELARVTSLVGTRAIPGIRDCRKLKVL